MAFLPKKWLRALWGIKAPEGDIEPPAPPETESARRTRPSARPHRYQIGGQVDWGGVFDAPGNVVPRRSRPSILN